MHHNMEQGQGVTDLPDSTQNPRAYWVTQQGVLQGEAARFQVLAETDLDAEGHLQATNAQLRAVTQRIKAFDEQKSAEQDEEHEAQRRGRRQVCCFMTLVFAGLLGVAIWALSK